MGNGYSSDKTFELRNLGREVDLTINGVQYKVSDNIPANTSLNTYIREDVHLKGTKFMCMEGGCGACIVAVTSAHPATGKPRTFAVNSCLIPIFACHGWSITTIEGLGNNKKGYNKISKRLAAANGTQCGYCSPGMVMNMYCLLEGNPNLTMKEVENSFGSNICRCTGYRPIMDAFKSMAIDAPTELKTKLQDIEATSLDCRKFNYIPGYTTDIIKGFHNCWMVEDLICFQSAEDCKTKCSQKCSLPDFNHSGLYLQLTDGSSWFRPANKKEVFEVLDMIGNKNYRFIAGNTGQGVYRYTNDPEVYIVLNGIPELHSLEVTAAGITLGGNVNLTEAMNFFYKLAKDTPNRFAYCQTLADHIDLIASIPVRNAGTIAGNIFMKHVHHEFPSDVFLILEMVGAQLTIAGASGVVNQVGMMEFLKTDMNRKLILNILLPSLDNKFYVTHSFKIMPRAQNAHAFVNAAFKFKLDPKSHIVMEKPTILFGGIEEKFLHAWKTEEYLKDKKLLSETTLKGALDILELELKPDHVPPDASPEYRRGLAMSLFYKFVLSVSPNEINEQYRSGGPLLQRPVSSAKQDFDTDSKIWPLNKPIPKIEGLLQCTGEAEYVNDIPHFPGQLWAQLVLCDRARAVVAKIDPSEALKMDGVVAFFSAEDIPGKNNFFPESYLFIETEVVFTEGRTSYAGEAVGVIVAETQALAIKAVQLVKIEYTDQQKVYISGRDIIQNNITERISEGPKGLEPSSIGKDVKYKINGKIDLKAQYHYTMEPLTCLTVPKENELDVYPTSQWPTASQEAVSKALKIPQNKINVHLRRVGGGYGAKITRICHTACVSSLAAYLLQKPVRLVLNLETNMEWAGKRFPIFSDYEAGVDGEGVIQFMNIKVYQDNGCAANDSPLLFTNGHLQNCYDSATWTTNLYHLKTDTASNTWCRAPSSTEGVCIIETIMEHIANAVGKDPVQVRLANIAKGDNPIPALIKDIRKASDYDQRVKEVEDFNKKNRWKKRGITLVPMDYPLEIFGFFHAIVSIFALDGTISITHGGVEMGQGINTKAVQVAAHILGVDIWKISVKPYNSNVTPNDASSGGSIASESVCYAVKMCCEELNRRLEPVKKELGEKATWEQITFKAYISAIDLQATYMEKPWEIKGYHVYGVTVLEVEVDVLTGQYQTRRVDLIEDTGVSLSPEIDIGQIEGAFIMGLGYYTCEELVYSSESGRQYTNRTWTYKPPGAKDIPIDFRVTLRKNAPNPTGVLRSKATGEPPLCMSCAVTFSIRNALESARKDSGLKQEVWFDLEYPYTAERIWLGCLTKKELFKIK